MWKERKKERKIKESGQKEEKMEQCKKGIKNGNGDDSKERTCGGEKKKKRCKEKTKNRGKETGKSKENILEGRNKNVQKRKRKCKERKRKKQKGLKKFGN